MVALLQMAVGVEVIARHAGARHAVNRIEIVSHQDVAGTLGASAFELGQVLHKQSGLCAAETSCVEVCKTTNTLKDFTVAAILDAESLSVAG